MNKHGRYYLSFGAFDNITDYETDFIFHWKNNTTDTIHYIRYRDYDLHVLCEKWQLNGVETTHPIVIKKAIGH
jgi:predicted small integral membrane protein